MQIGVPKEIKGGETRVSMTPNLCRRITSHGCRVLIEKGAGLKSGFTDAEYRAAGAEISKSAGRVWKSSDVILKVKEPLEAEFSRIQRGQTIFTYLHLAAVPALARELVRKGVLGIAYETVEAQDGSLPLLKPMSQIAGRLATQIGAYFLQSQNGGSGVLLGGVPGVMPGRVAIVGAGNSGAHSARIAAGMGAQVTILDLDSRKLDLIDSEYHNRLTTLMASPANIERAVAGADLVIGAVLIPGAKAPTVISKKMVRSMRPGSVIVDIAVDDGGCVETIHATSHSEPTYRKFDVLHYAVPNMPAMVGRTSTIALTQATEPFVALIAQKGVRNALAQSAGLAKGVNTQGGRITHPAVAAVLGEQGEKAD